MAFILADRVKETTTTTGTGTVTLAGAETAYKAFGDVMSDSDTTYYAIVDEAGPWEVGIGTFTAAGTLLSRDTVLESSNSDALVNFGVGTKDVFITYPASKAVYLDSSDNTVPSPGFLADAQTLITPATSISQVGNKDTAALTVDYDVNKPSAGDDTGIEIVKTETASVGVSKFIDAQKAGVSEFEVFDNGGLGLGNAGSVGFGFFPADNYMTLNSSGSTGTNIYVSPSAPFGARIRWGQTTLHTQTSGSFAMLEIKPEYNQTSGTASNTDLLVNRIETAVGSGTQLLADFQVGGVSQFSVANDGDVNLTGLANITFDGDADTFISREGSNKLRIASGGSNAAMRAGIFQVDSGDRIGWSATNAYAGNPDTAFSRAGISQAQTEHSTNAETSGTFGAFQINQTYNQASGTAANTDLLINRTETAVGSGDQLLADFQVGGVSQASIDNAGNQTLQGGLYFGDGNTGFREPSDNSLRVITGGLEAYSFDNTYIQSRSANGFSLKRNGVSSTVPAFGFLTDENTGVGLAAADQLSLIAGGVEQARFQVSGNHVINSLLDEATGDEAALTLEYETNKATSGIDYGMIINQTDTLSPSSILQDWRVDDVSKIKFYPSGKIFTMGYIEFASGNNNIAISGSVLAVKGSSGVVLAQAQSTAGATVFRIQSGTRQQIGSSGIQSFLSVTPTYNQTGTAGGTDLLINRTETAVGSGTQLLADFQVGGVSQASIDNSGQLTAAAGAWEIITGYMGATNTNRCALINETATATNPNILPNRSDLNTGIGGTSDELSLIAGGVEGIRVTEAAGAIETTFADDVIRDVASGEGTKIGDATTNDFGWRDILGEINVRGTGPADPSWTQIDATGFWDYQFDVNDECWINFHIPHDYVPGTDIHLHCHWLGNGTDTNNVKWEFVFAYADGFGNGTFPLGSPTTVTAEEAGSGTAYDHMVTETAAITVSGMEVDGILKVKVTRITNGATENTDDIFLIMADIHYQSSNLPTKNKAPDFYT